MNDFDEYLQQKRQREEYERLTRSIYKVPSSQVQPTPLRRLLAMLKKGFKH